MSLTRHSAAPLPAGAPVFRRRPHERRNVTARQRLVHRVIAEYREMPCLRLTPAQARRLFGLRDDVCARILGELVRERVLRIDDAGRYTVAD